MRHNNVYVNFFLPDARVHLHFKFEGIHAWFIGCSHIYCFFASILTPEWPAMVIMHITWSQHSPDDPSLLWWFIQRRETLPAMMNC
jgi:hypothetical protein